MSHHPDPQRYERQPCRRFGRSGLLLPTVSLGLWHGFGDGDAHANARDLVLGAFDRGITHFDLADNYGPPPGAAQLALGRLAPSRVLRHGVATSVLVSASRLGQLDEALGAASAAPLSAEELTLFDRAVGDTR